MSIHTTLLPPGVGDRKWRGCATASKISPAVDESDTICLLTKIVILIKRCLAISFILCAVCVIAEAKHSSYAHVNGTKLYYQTAGSGPWVVLIHGGLVDRRLWDDQFRQFAKNFSVLRYDLRGYGRSQFPDKPFSHIDDLYALVRSLKIE